MNRRKVLKNIGFSLGAVSATPTLVSLLSSCQNEPNWSPKLLSNSQIDFISNYIELIIPKTKDIPGGIELGLHKWVDICAKLILNKESQKNYLFSLECLINDTLNSASKDKIGELKINDYINQLKKFLLAENSKNKKWSKSVKNYWSKNLKDLNFENAPQEALAYSSLITLRQWTAKGYRFNEYIGKTVLDYRPVPGEQKGCVDLEETTGGLIWAI
ncbi:MAG: hypothetical protein CMC48_07875 [Flavobacteriaceae bacterium]|nr:hypothetical protein [Flavobacteriaceae bacterium]|tara:strand:+ start:325 stop:972 length:648 start_codon:yes stop_codon:yes gene_type:complete